jgi:hypothetical protein
MSDECHPSSEAREAGVMKVVLKKFGPFIGRRSVNDVFLAVGLLGVGFVTGWNMWALWWAFVASIHVRVTVHEAKASESARCACGTLTYQPSRKRGTREEHTSK